MPRLHYRPDLGTDSRSAGRALAGMPWSQMRGPLQGLGRAVPAALSWVRRGDRPLILLLALAMIQGLTYVAVVPPWNVPDEPQHFEYVRSLWLESQGQPAAPDIVEKAILASMTRHHWFQVNQMPVPTHQPAVFDDLPFFRLSDVPQGRQPEAYYMLSRLVLQLSGQTSIDAQLYVVRLLSVLLGVLVTVMAYLTASTAFPRDRRLAILIPAVVVLLPQRAFIAAGVNNDNLAMLASSLVFLVLIRFLAGGISFPRLLALAGGCFLVVNSKATAFAIVPSIFAVGTGAMLAEVSCRWSRKAAALVVVAGLAVAIIVVSRSFSPCGALHWSTYGDMPCPRVTLTGPAGKYALRVTDRSTRLRAVLYQQLTPDALRRVRGRTVTLGTWVRTRHGVQSTYMQLYDGRTFHTLAFTADPEWTFHSQTAMIASDASTLMVSLGASKSPVQATGEVFYSGIVLVAGDLSHSQAPQKIRGLAVSWDGIALTNAVENGTGEHVAYQPTPLIQGLLHRISLTSPVVAIQDLFEPDTLRPVSLKAYASYTSVLINSFWGQFGWMNHALPDWLYSALQSLTLLALVGAVWFVITRCRSAKNRVDAIEWQAVGLSLLVVFVGFAMAFFREIPPFGQSQGRYMLPVVVPFAIVFCVGLRTLCPVHLQRWAPMVVLALLIVLNLVSLLGVIIPMSIVHPG